MAKSPQSFENHAQFTPMYHYFTTPMGLIFLIWSVVRLLNSPGADTLYMLVGALTFFGLIAVSRTGPLKAQDRIIRLEMRLRLAQLLPADLQSRIMEITPRHLVALRFASDAELPELVRAVLANPSMTGKEIKQRIRDWQADYFRV
ncbi:MAG: DUF6526 family protein [Gemmatimonadaceae bacterium]